MHKVGIGGDLSDVREYFLSGCRTAVVWCVREPLESYSYAIIRVWYQWLVRATTRARVRDLLYFILYQVPGTYSVDVSTFVFAPAGPSNNDKIVVLLRLRGCWYVPGTALVHFVLIFGSPVISLGSWSYSVCSCVGFVFVACFLCYLPHVASGDTTRHFFLFPRFFSFVSSDIYLFYRIYMSCLSYPASTMASQMLSVYYF